MTKEKILFDRIMLEGHRFDHNSYLNIPEKNYRDELLEPIWMPEYMDIELKREHEGQVYVDGFYPGTYRCYIMSLYVRLSWDWKEAMDERVRVRYEVFRIKDENGVELEKPKCVCNCHGGESKTFPMPAFFEDLPRFVAYALVERLGV